MSAPKHAKGRRRRALAQMGLLILLLCLPGSVRLDTMTGYAGTAQYHVPADTQEDALAVLVKAGYALVAPPSWAGAVSAWQAPGVYALFFAARSPSGSVDVYAAQVHVDDQGQVTHVWNLIPLTDTPAGDETAPVLAGRWLAFATRVAGLYQSLTCIRLDDLRRSLIFAFDRPAEQVRLRWKPAPASADQTLVMTIVEPAGETAVTIDPARQLVEPADAGLRSMSIVRGEQAWLPNLVSRVRELPGVGPEKIAFIENVFFTLQDRVTRTLYGPASLAPEQVATASPAPEATSIAPVSDAESIHSTSMATRALSPSSSSMATVTPVSVTGTHTSVVRSTMLPTRTATRVLAPTNTPTRAPSVLPVGRLTEGIVRRASVRPDPQRPYAEVELIEIDPGLLQIKMLPGTWEPRPTTGLVGSGVIPQQDWPNLAAAFNGGFAAMHGHFGMMVDRKVYLPAREGVATLAVYEDGSLRMGTWGRELNLTPDMVSYRQNCIPLIENGMITAETGKLTLWGLSISNQVYLYRSGLGMTADGRLVYAAGKSLSAYTLARAMQMAGVQYAMQLDVDEYHVVFILYDVQPGPPLKVEGRKLRSDMHGFDGFFLRPFQLDFFYLVRRSQRLASPVRYPAPVSSVQPAAPTLLPTLPGHLAFASDRDGNWEIYTMPAAEPMAARRLTDHPADDLYPAWSADGRMLAFTSRRDGNAEVYILSLADGALRRVTQKPSEEWAPSWSPNGLRLAYQSDRNGQSDIYVSAPDGSSEQRLTPYQGNHESPHWSPDGKLLAFDSDLDVAEPVHASINLYLMNADGSYPRRFVSNAESPAWSPDGKTVAFTSLRTGHWQISAINTDGTGYRQLTNGNYDARHPTWSPDGRWLAFAGNQEGHWELYLVPAVGGQPFRLTFGTASHSYPAWGP